MTEAARARGITLTSRSRPLTPQDLADFDYIVGMDHENLAAIYRAAAHWASSKAVAADYKSKVPASCIKHGHFRGCRAAADLLHGLEKQLQHAAAHRGPSPVQCGRRNGEALAPVQAFTSNEAWMCCSQACCAHASCVPLIR